MMFKEFITSVVSLSFLAVVSDMLMPEGTMKKYLSLTFGFMMMCALIAPITKTSEIELFEFSFDSEITNDEIQAKSDAYILKLHEENIRKYIVETFGEGTEAFVQLYADGRVKGVTIYTQNQDLHLLNEMKKTLGCENIEIAKRHNDDT